MNLSLEVSSLRILQAGEGIQAHSLSNKSLKHAAHTEPVDHGLPFDLSCF